MLKYAAFRTFAPLVFVLIVLGLLIHFWYITVPLAALGIGLWVAAHRKRQAELAARQARDTAETRARLAAARQRLGDGFPLFVQGAVHVIGQRSASVASLQRGLQLTNRGAQDLMAVLEGHQVVTPRINNRQRRVLMSGHHLPLLGEQLAIMRAELESKVTSDPS